MARRAEVEALKRSAAELAPAIRYKLEYESKGPRLFVASLDMDRPENRGRKP